MKKNKIITFVLLLLTLFACENKEDNNNSAYIEPLLTEKLIHSYIRSYDTLYIHKRDSVKFFYNIDRISFWLHYKQDYSYFPSCDSNDIVMGNPLFDSLSNLYGDTVCFTSKGLFFVITDTIEALNIYADSYFSANYQEGAKINDIVSVNFKHGENISNSNVDCYDFWETEMPLNTFNEIDRFLVSLSCVAFHFTENPESNGTYSFTYEYKTTSGKTITGSFSQYVDLNKDNLQDYNIPPNK